LSDELELDEDTDDESIEDLELLDELDDLLDDELGMGLSVSNTRVGTLDPIVRRTGGRHGS
jgi:hypothetical protein